MNIEVWQQLFSLESHDIVQKWFKQIHSRELNARRSYEINAAARQAREYFSNASNADISVRPLLTFYGVASLSRSLILLLKSNGGEEGLKSSHGLETVAWSNTFSGEVASGLRSLPDLRIKTCSGLFTDFVSNTDNLMPLHVSSEKVDWHVEYQQPPVGKEFSVDDLFSRLPDLESDYKNISKELKFARCNTMTFKQDSGFTGDIFASSFEPFKTSYETLGYTTKAAGAFYKFSCTAQIYSQNTPMFVHSYVNKSFGVIPSLHIVEPFSGGARYSQLAITYMVSYVLGMLVRYYPTHWVAMTKGSKGDEFWPSINRAQRMVEVAFPEMVAELIALKTRSDTL